MTYTNHCEGCRIYTVRKFHGNDDYCEYRGFNNDGTCPCCVCVVKMMCHIACPDFDLFVKNTKERYKL